MVVLECLATLIYLENIVLVRLEYVFVIGVKGEIPYPGKIVLLL